MERPEVQSLNKIEHTHTVCLSTIHWHMLSISVLPKDNGKIWQITRLHASATLLDLSCITFSALLLRNLAAPHTLRVYPLVMTNSLLLKMAHRNSWLKMVIFHSYVSLPEGSCFVEFRYFQHFIKLRTAKGHHCCPHWTIKGFSSLGWIPYSHTQGVGWMATKEPNFT